MFLIQNGEYRIKVVFSVTIFFFFFLGLDYVTHV